jgi:hypothetical protein
MAPKFVCHSPFIVCVAVVYECLKVLNVVFITENLELDDRRGSIGNLQFLKFEEEIRLQFNRFKLVG